jgi:hypothetical protein
LRLKAITIIPRILADNAQLAPRVLESSNTPLTLTPNPLPERAREF